MTKKSTIFTEEPHYLPKYCGYLPQYKYRIGKTYGRHSVEILKDESVSKSGKLILAPLNDGPTSPGMDQRRQILANRSVTLGNQTLTDSMLPGYTGYIPKRQHYFAKRYADVCRSAISHHEIEQHKRVDKQMQLKSIFAMQNGELQPLTSSEKAALRQREITPLQPVPSPPPRKFRSTNEFKPNISPYSLDNNSDMKWFKTGFTGFVPRTRDLIALDYKRQCNAGLKRFSDHQKQTRNREAAPVVTDSPKLSFQNTIYPVDKGMLPKYTGYIPGYKYMIGQTYGQQTRNTLNLPAA